MANTAANVLPGKPLATGGILRAPLGTALADDALTTLNVAFLGVGYIGSDGVVQQIGEDKTEIKAWGGDTVLVIQTSHTVTYTFTMIEATNATAQAAYYGDDNYEARTGGSTARLKAGDLSHYAWDIELSHSGRRGRITIGDGQITERGDVTYKDDECIAYTVTVTCFTDADGNKASIHWDDEA